MGAPEVAAFLNYLAQERAVAVATQNQVLNALLFLYEVMLGADPRVAHLGVRCLR